MPKTGDRPADTTMMGVVHDALRRDLAHHHQGEDDGLWPLVRARAPEAAELVDRMAADHARVIPAVDEVGAAARRCRADPSEQARADLLRLAAEGHWLMDGLDPQRYDILVHLVPQPVRVLIVKGFARRYRAACARRWGPEVPVAPLPRVSTAR
jgi:hypothetical protein